MVAATTAFPLERYRGYLLLLARAAWNDVLRGWGDPSDLVQQTLLEAHEKRGGFTGETSAEFAGWLRTALAHNIADVTRGRTRAKRDYRLERSLEALLEESSARMESPLAYDDPSPSEQAVHAEQMNDLSDAIAQLPADQGEAVVLHHLRGLTLEEVARQMGRTRAAVAGLYRRGVKRIGKLMRHRE
jgi:RNA polymerase sigma-70 factor (ECF subfamily)